MADPHALEPIEHLDAVVIGAGLSGIGAGHHLQTTCPWASYAIFEARDAIGGTWDLFRYPGIRSDSDMFTLGYPFRPWTGEKSIADGDTILAYIRDTAAAEGIDRHIRFGRKVTRADWSSDEARWTLTVEDVHTGETSTVTCNFLHSCSGYYRYDHGYQPDFPGMDRFGGTVVHPQAWPEDLDWTGKKVVVIGSGATAVTLVPSLAADAEHVTMLQRSPTWVAAVPARNPAADLLRRTLPERYAGDAVRWTLALGTQATYHLSKRRPQIVKRALRKGLERELPDGYDIDTHFTPSYDPWDQRLCAARDGDLFRAIRKGDASVVTDRIDTFTETGLRLESGTELDVDIIVTATGLELLFLGGIELRVDGEAVEVGERLAYRGVMLEGVPNLSMAVGYTNASWTLKANLNSDFTARLMNRLRQLGLRQATPRRGDAELDELPLLGLNSGYIERSADRFPKQSSVDPWRMHQSYLRDHRAMTSPGAIDDDALELSNPAPALAAAGGVGSITQRSARFLDRVAAITGAGSGIGRALAIELSRRGCHLALSDVDEAGLAETVGRCEGSGVKVTSALVDVADRAAVDAWATQVVDEHGRVNLIFNNAGVALGATVESMTDENLDWLMGINFRGVVHGTSAFLPHLTASGDGHVVNISSVFGLISVPSQSAYNASKFAVRGYTDALRMELEIERSPVSATTVHPGGIRTNIARNARLDDSVLDVAGSSQDAGETFDRIARTSPASAARQILAAVEKDRRRALIGADAVAIDLISRLPAGLYQRVLVAGARRGRR
jgi:cation diffusion facilitator CzcD-associated flavoprotein CzcO/NAD(P)-dependent dehydrogenase (short-subunit alcohol dehydrogenase family)